MAKGKSRKKKYIFLGIIGIVLIAIVFLVIAQGNKESITFVQTEKVEIRTITETVTATGNIESEFQVEIRPEVTGEVVQLPVNDGDMVKKNSLLMKIKPDKYIAQKQSFEANLQSAKANLSIQEAQLKQIKLEYNRVKELHEKSLSSDQELEAITSRLEQAEAQLQSAEASVMQREAALREVLEELYKTTIQSPITGTITMLSIELGERVLGSGFSQGTHVMTVSDLDNMEAIVEVDENDIVNVELGDTARVEVDAFGDKEFVGIVHEIGNSAVTSGMGTQDQVVNFMVKIKIVDTDHKLKPGMSCNAEIETQTRKDVVSVPIQSVTARIEKEDDENGIENGEKKYQEIVFLVEEGRAKRVDVETGISDDNYIEVTKGLNGGEEVVSGSYRAISKELSDSTLVMVENKGSGLSKTDDTEE